MLIGKAGFRRDAMNLFRYRPRNGGDSVERKLLPTIEKRRIPRHGRVERFARPSAPGLHVECLDAVGAPAPNPSVLGAVTRRSRLVVLYAKVVVEPYGTWPEGSVKARHPAHVGEKLRLARTAAEPARCTTPAVEPAPCHSVHTCGRAGRIGMSERSLESYAGNDSEGAQLRGVPRKPPHMIPVPFHLGVAYMGREPHFVAGLAVFLQYPECLRPVFVVCGVLGRGQADHEERRRLHARRRVVDYWSIRYRHRCRHQRKEEKSSAQFRTLSNLHLMSPFNSRS